MKKKLHDMFNDERVTLIKENDRVKRKAVRSVKAKEDKKLRSRLKNLGRG